MKSELKYVGITHERATVSQRSLFALNEQEQHSLRCQLMKRYPLKGLLLLFTCNRTEIYFESESVSGNTVKRFLLDLIQSSRKTVKSVAGLVDVFETTHQTAMHLFYVAHGLRSAIPGDRQVIGQLRTAFRQSLKSKHQGSLLERCMQHIFRSHKQVCNQLDSLCQNSMISTKIINAIDQHFPVAQDRIKLLMIGAGAMAKEILPALHKSERFEISVANRTAEKADKLSRTFNASTVDWKLIEANKIDAFDVIITAISHRKNLISHISPAKAKKVLIDLAMPSNIDRKVQGPNIVLYNIDLLYKQQDAGSKDIAFDHTRTRQIIRTESLHFFKWYEEKMQRHHEAA